MVILYIGPSNRPDFQTEFYLSPIVAPDSLLAKFPPVYFLTGERDPLVDDTVIMAGRIRTAKQAVRRHRRDVGLEPTDDGDDGVQVCLIQGISHGFLQMSALFPQAEREIRRCAGWLNQILEDVPDADEEEEEVEEEEEEGVTGTAGFTSEEDRPLEIGGGIGGRGLSTPRDGTPRSGTPRGSSAGGRVRRKQRSNIIPKNKRTGSTISLGSEEDLLGRRMTKLTKGLATTGSDREH